MKNLRRGLKIFSLLLLLPVVAIIIFVATFDANNYKVQIIEQVEEATGRKFNIEGEIELSIFPWIGLKVDAASLGNAKGFKAPQFASIEQLDIKVHLLPLLKKEVEVKTLRLHGLNVSLEVDKDKSNNWSGLIQSSEVKSSAPGNAPPVSADTKPAILDQSASDDNTDSALPLLNIKGIELVDSVVHYDDRSTNTNTTVSALNLKTGNLRFDEPVDVNFSARIENKEPAIDTHVKLTTKLTLNEAFTVFNLRDVVLTVVARANEFIKQDETLEIKSSIDVSMDEELVTLKQLQLTALGVKALADIKVTQLLKTPLIQGVVEVQPFNAKSVAKRVGIELPDMENAKALQELSLKTKIKMQGEKLEANDFRLSVDKSVFSGWVHMLNISKQQLRYELAAEQFNADHYLPLATEDAVIDKSTPAYAAAVEASENAKIELPIEMMRKLDLQGNLRIAALRIKTHDVKQFLMTAKAAKGEIDINPLSMQVLEGSVISKLKLNVQNKMPAYTVNMDVKQLHLGPVVDPMLKEAMKNETISIKGTANLLVDIKASGETMKQLKQSSLGKIVLDMKDTEVHDFDPEHYMRKAIAGYVQSKGLDLSEAIISEYKAKQKTVFDVIHGTVNLAQGKATTNDFIMRSPQVQVTAEGQVGILQNTMDMMSMTKLTSNRVTLDKMLAEPIYVRVHGPFNALTYDLDRTRLAKSAVRAFGGDAKAKVDAEKLRLKEKVDAEKQELKDRADAERQRVEEKAKQQINDKLKDKLKGLF